MPAPPTAPRGVDAFSHVVRAVGDVVAEVRGRSRPGRAAVPDPRGGIRLSDAERNDAAEILRDAYADGRLDLAEFEDRLTAVHAARVHADLLPTLADLPGGRAGGPLGAPAALPPDEVVTAVLREVRREGRWELPPRLSVQARAGTVVLDLRAARVRSDVVEIDVRVTAGRVVIIVPHGVPVELRDGLTLLGGRHDRLAGRRSGRPATVPKAGSPPIRLIVGGEIVGGHLVVRPPSVRERWRGV